ncbi:hypothetical protein [uncultured Pigmentiphaga sp.]|uniref:hypothetical protein n=1 Tax=uncultured Pigmentiphaga sp. TaxID=340361 RepID=UPI0026263289|nr:hypothetical protein [uncultured Pigmentiphaga sp.]
MKIISTIACLGAVVISASAAHAEVWGIKTDEDPLDDTKTAVVTQLQKGGGLNPFALGAKCWEGRPGSTTLMLASPMRYDHSASYKDQVDVVFRVDKNEKITIPLAITELGGRLIFATTAEQEENVFKLFSQIAAAKQRIGVGVEGTVLTFPAKGAAKAFAEFTKTCSLPLTPSS